MLSSLIQVFTVWPEGTMFAILLGNMFAPITDYAINQSKQKTKNK
jgi:Na+-translocating ferredoxin:NAD+ oxidoreductase RnfD subunit